MLTNDIKSLAPGAGTQAALLSRLGKLVTDLVVYRHEESVLLEMERERVGPLMEALSRYIVSEDVRLDDVSGVEALISIEGPRSAELLSRLSNQNQTSLDLEPYHFTESLIDETPLRCSAVRHGPGPGFDLAVPATRSVFIAEQIMDKGKDFGLHLAGARTTETRRIEAGIPMFGVDMDESHLVLEAGLQDAVSFNKGCYIGQEYVARLAHRGHLNKKLVGLKLEGTNVPSGGNDITGGGRNAGRVTCARYSPTLGCPLALGYVHRDFFDPEREVGVLIGEEEVPARVAKLPFIGMP
jgi:folate-binding protein YgfZ